MPIWNESRNKLEDIPMLTNNANGIYIIDNQQPKLYILEKVHRLEIILVELVYLLEVHYFSLPIIEKKI